jgi:alcohol dehydrogenase YqhD (iron-dependent ADH family)
MLNNFTFYLKTKLVFGEDALNKLPSLLNENNAKNVLLVYGRSYVKKSGLLDEVLALLNEAEVNYFTLEGVTSNPDIHFVREGLKIAKANNVDFVLAIGGGSVIDVGKGIANAFYLDDDPIKLYKRAVKPAKALPIGVILTVSAAGSEMSTSSVLSDYENNFKQGFNSETNRPTFAITNPKYTYSLSEGTTSAGIVDILMHTLERYFSESSDLELADGFAVGLLKTVMKAGRELTNGQNVNEARALLMLASSFSHNGITSIGKGYTMPMHQLEHAISALNPKVAHGHGLAVMWGPWALESYHSNFDKFYAFSLDVMGLTPNENDKESVILEGIKLLKDYFVSLGVKVKLRDYGFTKDDVLTLTNIATTNGTNGVRQAYKTLNKDEVLEIYTKAF